MQGPGPEGPKPQANLGSAPISGNSSSPLLWGEGVGSTARCLSLDILVGCSAWLLLKKAKFRDQRPSAVKPFLLSQQQVIKPGGPQHSISPRVFKVSNSEMTARRCYDEVKLVLIAHVYLCPLPTCYNGSSY